MELPDASAVLLVHSETGLLEGGMNAIIATLGHSARPGPRSAVVVRQELTRLGSALQTVSNLGRCSRVV